MAVRPARERSRARAASKARSKASREPARDGRLLAERVHGAHRAQVLRCIGRGVGQPVLGRPRQPAHRAAIGQQREDDHRNGRQSEGRQRGARHEHHRQRADQHDEVAKRLAQRRPGRRLDLRGVGSQAAHHLAGVRAVVEGRAEGRQMPEHVRAQVGDHPFAQPVDGIHAPRARHRQHQADADQRDEVAVDEDPVVGCETDVDHAADGDRHRQHGTRRRHERDQGHEHHAEMTRQVRPQGHQRRELAPVRRGDPGVRIGFRQGSGLAVGMRGAHCPRREGEGKGFGPRR